MTQGKYSRRDFSHLTVAAVGGMIAGAGTGARQETRPGVLVDPAILVAGDQPNVCRGLNACKDKGKGKHECAGQSSCATAAAHTCGGNNDCKGQGGCDGYPGQNVCKGKGHCGVPLSDKTWEIARKQLEHLMKDGKRKIGKAPPK